VSDLNRSAEDIEMPTRPTDQELSGMTVNERLFTCGLFDRWDAAVRARRREEMISVLCDVALTKEQAAYTVDGVLANPAKYGF
jgi:hypothetical protein